MAENYEEVVRGWGYNMPEVTNKLNSMIDPDPDHQKRASGFKTSKSKRSKSNPLMNKNDKTS